MKHIVVLLFSLFSVACASPNRVVYSSGFSFSNYDYVVVGKPDGQGSTTLYGMDVEFANLLSKYNMNIIGDKEFESMSPENKKRSLYARMSLSASDAYIVLTVSFDDAVTGRIGSSVTGSAKGNLFDGDDRGKAFESVASTVIKALQKDRGLKIIDEK